MVFEVAALENRHISAMMRKAYQGSLESTAVQPGDIKADSPANKRGMSIVSTILGAGMDFVVTGDRTETL